ncbi:tetratricopeptide repeat protein [Aquisphaera giovannonii]|nr:tetratricopeptide repeat protein [Aquisphaera giovannonii]
MRSWIAAGLLGAAACAGLALLAARDRGRPAGGADAYGRGDWAGAATGAREALKRRPADRDALRLLARASARLGKDDAAEAIYRRLGASAMQPEDLFLLGRGLLARGQPGPGLAALGAALDADPDHAESLHARALHRLRARSLLPAEDDARRLSGRPGWGPRARLLLGRIRRELLDPAGAATFLDDAIKDGPAIAASGADLREIRLLLATSLIEAARPAEAREVLRAALAAGPDPRASWLLSRACLLAGEAGEAGAALDDSGEGRDGADPLRSQPSPYAGASRCEPCHAAKFRSQQQSRHARTFLSGPGLAEVPWPSGIVEDGDAAGVSHVFRKGDGRVSVATRVQGRSFAAVLAYGLGSNHQGRTFVGRDASGGARELRISEYPNAPAWARTSEHPARPPDDAGYLGRPLGEESLRRCLDCHATNFRAALEPAGRPEAGDHGIGCERCHGPGAIHVRSAELHFADLAIARPSLAPADRVVALCADCHRAPDASSRPAEGFIRFQAPTLVRSRCYAESGTMSCVTCHDPHRDASRKASDYEAICLRCHPGSQPREAAPATVATPPGRERTWAPCPTRATRGCLDCHMPRIAEAVPRTVFTDHHIRVRRDEGPR